MITTSNSSSIASSSQFIDGPQGMRIHSCTFGDPAATHTLICLHGFMQALECFKYQYAELPLHDCYVIGVDMPYHGRTELPEGLTLSPELWAQSIEAVLHHYHRLAQPVVLLGWSMAGFALRNYLQLQGARQVAGLILVGTTLDFSMLAQPIPEVMEVMEIMARLTDERRADEAILDFVDRLWHIRPTLGQYYQTLGYNFTSYTKVKKVISAIQAQMITENTAAFLEGLTCPILLVQGLEDALVPPMITRQFAAMCKPEQIRVLELAGVGHSPFIERPKLFNAAVLDFLRGPVHQFMKTSMH